MPISLPPLPYDFHALEPHISERTLQFHYGKHHQGYVNTLNTLIQGSELETLPLEDIIHQSYQNPERVGIFNNAAQVWNHTFYWSSMKPSGGGEPTGPLKDAIERDFGSYQTFRDHFKQAALTQFGSGWTWLVKTSSGKLAVQKTSNADVPFVRQDRPLVTLDVWEHAYYLDYQNRRADYAEIFLGSLVNWDFAAQRLALG